DLVFANKGRCGYLRHHETRVQAGARCQKWGQAFVQRRVDQALETALADSGEGAEGDGKEIESEGDGFAVEVAAREDVAFGFSQNYAGGWSADGAWLGEDERIIDRGVDFRFHNFATVSECVANGAVDLRHAAQRVGVLDALTVAMGFADLAALE